MEKTVHIGFGTIHGFRHSLRSWNVCPMAEGGATVYRERPYQRNAELAMKKNY